MSCHSVALHADVLHHILHYMSMQHSIHTQACVIYHMPLLFVCMVIHNTHKIRTAYIMMSCTQYDGTCIHIQYIYIYIYIYTSYVDTCTSTVLWRCQAYTVRYLSGYVNCVICVRLTIYIMMYWQCGMLRCTMHTVLWDGLQCKYYDNNGCHVMYWASPPPHICHGFGHIEQYGVVWCDSIWYG